MKRKGRIGSSFDDFLKDEGVYEEVTAKAIKRVIARQLGAVMRENHLTKSMLARRMRTSLAKHGDLHHRLESGPTAPISMISRESWSSWAIKPMDPYRSLDRR